MRAPKHIQPDVDPWEWSRDKWEVSTDKCCPNRFEYAKRTDFDFDMKNAENKERMALMYEYEQYMKQGNRFQRWFKRLSVKLGFIGPPV